ncbi:MAG: hypothetical protein AB8B80_16975 [Marinicellaceae bacterium]
MKFHNFIFSFFILSLCHSATAREYHLNLGSYLSTKPSMPSGIAVNAANELVIGLTYNNDNSEIQFRKINSGELVRSNKINGSINQLISAAD